MTAEPSTDTPRRKCGHLAFYEMCPECLAFLPSPTPPGPEAPSDPTPSGEWVCGWTDVGANCLPGDPCYPDTCGYVTPPPVDPATGHTDPPPSTVGLPDTAQLRYYAGRIGSKRKPFSNTELTARLRQAAAWIDAHAHCGGATDDTALESLRELSNAATPGPWTEGGSHREVYTNSDEISDDNGAHYVITDDGGIDHPEDQAFIVAAVNYVRRHLAAARPSVGDTERQP